MSLWHFQVMEAAHYDQRSRCSLHLELALAMQPICVVVTKQACVDVRKDKSKENS
jgi:hypothetical protein